MKNATATHFDYAAQKFDSFYEEESKNSLGRWIDRSLRKSMRERFDRTFEVLQPLEGKTVLDIGCGSGRYTVVCAELGARQVVGTDFAPAMIDIAQRISREAGLEDKVQFILGDHLDQEYPMTFDAAIVMGVFDYVADPVSFIQKTMNDVKGTVVASFPVRYDLWAFQRKVRYRLFKRCPLYFYSQRRLQTILEKAGVKQYNIRKCHRDFVVDFLTI